VASILNLDKTLFLIINSSHNYLLDYLMLAASVVAEYGLIWIVAAAILLIIDKKHGRTIFVLIAGVVVVTFLIDDVLIRQFVYRERPYLALDNIHQLGIKWTSSSFPSRHASLAVASAIILGKYYKNLMIPLVLFVLIILYSRPYLGMHYPLDILAGVGVGIISAKLAIWFERRYLTIN